MRRIVIALATLLAGCATQDEWHWEKPGAGQYEFNMDQGQCRAQALGVAGAPLVQVVLVLHSCLEGKGWYKVADR